MIYTCICGESKDIHRSTIRVVNEKVVVSEALCKCGEYMTADPIEGMPNLIRTDPSLDRVKDRDKRDKIIKENRDII